MKTGRAVINLILVSILLNPVRLFSQSGYLAGTAQSSIEPDQSLISLHLAGYGAPREGRFTLEWKAEGSSPAPLAMTGVNGRLYIVSGGNLLYLTPSVSGTEWKNAGKADNIVSIAGFDGKLLALAGNGELYETSTGEKTRWKKIGAIGHDATQIAAAENTFFATDKNGTLWTTDLLKKGSSWKKGESVINIISLSANGDKLYALTGEGVIYRRNISGIDQRWLKIAYRNNQTIREDIKFISFLNDRIWGISGDNSLYLGQHRSEGNLTARALAIKDGERTVIILNVDILGLEADFTGMLKKEIWLKHNIPASAVFINFTHTHFAPVAQNFPTWQEANQKPDSLYLFSTIKNGILDAVAKALDKMEPAELYFGRGTTDIGYNRSLKDHPELYDSDVDVLKITCTDKKSESYLFMTACHPVFSTFGSLHYTISANYPGVARKLVEERTGTSNSLFLQGTAGDINPKDNGEYITGEKLANDVLTILNNPMRKIEGPLSFFLDTVKIGITPWDMDEIAAFRRENADKPGDVYAEKNVKWCDLMMDYYSKGIMPETLPVYVQTLNIGNWKLVGFSRETTTGYSFGVKRMWPDKLVSVAGYTNDVSSYLPTHMHLEAETYEGLDSFFWYGSPNVFPMNSDEVILNQIKALAR